MAGRWHQHGWNTALALRLILTVVPRLPRLLVPPLAGATTALCLACMRQERRAAARNLRRILGRDGWRLALAVWRLFYAYSRFMVGTCDLQRLGRAELLERTEQDGGVGGRLADALAAGRGVIVLTAHLGNWEVGARLLAVGGRPVNVVMQEDRGNPAERWLSSKRRRDEVAIIPAGAGLAGTVALRAALARNEVVAMQGDRAPSGRIIDVDLFGGRFGLPVGPFLLAYSSETPLLPTFVVQRGWSRWRVEMDEAVVFPRTGDREADLRAGAGSYARALERAVRRYPEQWFNFYDLWPAT